MCSARASGRVNRTSAKSATPSRISGNRRPVPQDEPPAVVARVLGDAGEQLSGLLVAQWEQGELLSLIERRDDTRREPAELSGAGVEENRACDKGRHGDHTD